MSLQFTTLLSFQNLITNIPFLGFFPLPTPSFMLPGIMSQINEMHPDPVTESV